VDFKSRRKKEPELPEGIGSSGEPGRHQSVLPALFFAAMRPQVIAPGSSSRSSNHRLLTIRCRVTLLGSH
jgi:hypothetical protein